MTSLTEAALGVNDQAHILIADDDPHCQTTTAAFLANKGYRCDCASSGEEAIALLKSNRYDLLLSDIQMPGNQDLQLIKSIPGMQAGLPVILMTGYPTIQTATRSVGLSVAAYLMKPVDPDALLVEVNRAIERSKAYRTISSARTRLVSLCDDLKKIETLSPVADENEKNAALMMFLDLTVHNIAGSLLDLRNLIESLVNAQGQNSDFGWLQSARPIMLVSAMRETISVLAKTKGSFKSKELADLRRKLEGLLQDPPAAQI
jgi:DNA-binding response OmpR family regulator